MKITVQSLGMTPHAPLEEFLQKKIQKLETFYSDILEAKLILKKENSSTKENKNAELILLIPGEDIVVKKTFASFEQSIDACVDASKKLLIKKKEK